ncbi:5-methyltetrahydropteroyltriglutamate--homocysteine methyltransferase [Pseudooceanicola marinus]|uniref:5-methyltetrahydropteroyltriglutamate--homocysteine methyltransferase n=1 Tax=Pseudooceanicola marinus TaxID=396013 RepID=A0A1X6YN66_9RHOB|nr:5-methyltetrahydropteroyltriglutamate--homocysteine S-methyltransferase [Pseudooceanicola marinus]PJE29427.1 5-methyltetrahydropteroyltriglutamate--homocysteine S-methyltransferase [Pseudooceanicola marinus]SLN25980.1 5-methyltetrahydropteroyltriglutamate--homocysteine methyltransferase [Pseudooceanicola marinus]
MKDEMTKSTLKPPFRADHVGSLLRPTAVAEARKAGVTGDALREIEDREIPAMIKMQEEVGLKVVTDGEARRAFWHFDYMGMLDGLDLVQRDPDAGIAFHGVKTPPTVSTITKKLDFPADHPMLEHFKFVKEHTSVCPKISIPGPSAAHFRTAPEDIFVEEYKDPEVFTAALAECWKKAVGAFYDAGCRYLQLDDIFFAYLGDPKHRALWESRGQDPDWLINRYAWMLNEAIKDRPEDMTIGMHMCRGNFRSTHAAEGSYEAAADAIFNKADVDIYFMEYDTDRAGGLEPLRLLPKGNKRVMAGFITTKTPELESMDDIKRKFEEASKYADMDQLGIAPQCGFSSTEEGNEVTMDDQRRKLELVIKVSQELWDDA